MQITINKLIADELKTTFETLRIEREREYGDTHIELSSGENLAQLGARERAVDPA